MDKSVRHFYGGYRGQTLANTYNKLSISFNNWEHTNAQNREILLKNKTVRVLQNTPKFEIQDVHHFSVQEMDPIEATKNFKALSLS